MKKLNTPVGIIFGLLSLVCLLRGDGLSAGLNALLGAGFWLSDLFYGAAPNGPNAFRVALPAWRRYTSIALVVAALGLFGYQIGRDFSAKANRSTTTRAK